MLYLELKVNFILFGLNIIKKTNTVSIMPPIVSDTLLKK